MSPFLNMTRFPASSWRSLQLPILATAAALVILVTLPGCGIPEPAVAESTSEPAKLMPTMTFTVAPAAPASTATDTPAPPEPSPTATIMPPTATSTLAPTSTATSTPSPPLKVVASFPIAGDEGVPKEAPLRIRFDRPVDTAVAESALLIEPAIEGKFVWQDQQEMIFQPGHWTEGIPYTITLDGAIALEGGRQGSPWRITFSSRPGGRVPLPILMYHRLIELSPTASAGVREWTTDPRMFAQHLTYVRDNEYNPVPLLELMAYLEGSSPLPARPLAITFDDGYVDFYTVGWPLLQQHGFPATMFIIPSHVGYGAFLTWEQMQEMEAGGMAFGSHTLDHVSLRGLAPEELAWQLNESRRLLEEHLAGPITTLSYAYGGYDSASITAAQAAGYVLAVTINPTPHQVRGRLFELSRVHAPYDATIGQFAALLPHGEGAP